MSVTVWNHKHALWPPSVKRRGLLPHPLDHGQVCDCFRQTPDRKVISTPSWLITVSASRTGMHIRPPRCPIRNPLLLCCEQAQHGVLLTKPPPQAPGLQGELCPPTPSLPLTSQLRSQTLWNRGQPSLLNPDQTPHRTHGSSKKSTVWSAKFGVQGYSAQSGKHHTARSDLLSLGSKDTQHRQSGKHHAARAHRAHIVQPHDRQEYCAGFHLWHESCLQCTNTYCKHSVVGYL